jgi:putative beta-barrel porin
LAASIKQPVKKISITILLCLCLQAVLHAQVEGMRRTQNLGNQFRGGSQGTKADSLKHRSGLEDSITINFRYLDTSRLRTFDSSVKDFTKKFPVPWSYVHLGNLGNAARDLIFTPRMQSGWDHGFHAYDIYAITIPQLRFFNTTRPYTEIGYMLGSQAEQMIHLLHTRNIKPNWNASLQYRLINAPGFFQNQNTNHSSYNFSSWYVSKNKRYQNYFVANGNKLQSGENGGIKNNANYLDSSTFDDRFTIPVNIGNGTATSRNFFTTTIISGTLYSQGSFLLRQSYDLGQKDSLVINDTTVVPLFYPRVRLQHTISYNSYKYRFKDQHADSAYYYDAYKFPFDKPKDTVIRQDIWKELVNDFSIYTFPDAKNPLQFLRLGATLQNLSGNFDTGLIKKDYYNFFVHGEYRNKSRNQKWDIEAIGKFHVTGLNAGDYNVDISLKRMISKKLGYLEVGFANVNRTPSFVFNQTSSFYLDTAQTLKKENNTRIYGSYDMPRQKLKLTGSYYLLSNYTFYHDYYHINQTSAIFNILQFSAEKEFRLSKNWIWRIWAVVQQRAGDAPVNLPFFLTRNQIGYDGNLGFKNLLISMGFEVRYFTPYKANDYSPVIGQFNNQDTVTVRLERPDIGAYLHFRIKSFTAYVRAENLNTLEFSPFGFKKNNIPTINYPYPGLQIRVGIFWSFVN